MELFEKVLAELKVNPYFKADVNALGLYERFHARMKKFRAHEREDILRSGLGGGQTTRSHVILNELMTQMDDKKERDDKLSAEKNAALSRKRRASERLIDEGKIGKNDESQVASPGLHGSKRKRSSTGVVIQTGLEEFGQSMADVQKQEN